MSFIQESPQLGNQYRDDAVLRSYLHRALSAQTLAAIEPDLDALGDYAAQTWTQSRARAPEEPQLTHWDAWGNRIDRVELTEVWKAAAPLAARYGLVAAGHETTHGTHARAHQFALVYLFHCSSEFFTCPLAMSDGAATALKASRNAALIERALPHLLSRDPAQHWMSGQWMTETIGGSDVSHTETVAREVDGEWRLSGRKWFTSGINGHMALALARPEGAPPGSQGLALFYVEMRDAQGQLNGIRVDRLKDKLGTRHVPTAELHLDGARAQLVGEARNGVRSITPMLNVTRTWNAVCAIATMRRALALAQDYAQRRSAFGKPLAQQPLHRATLATMQAQFAAAFHFTFEVVELLGKDETGTASVAEKNLLRLLTPLVKLWTGKLAIAIASEACECFGGAGYIENTGMPGLLRDAQVYSIWEGTTNVLSLDFLRALRSAGGVESLLNAQAGWRAQIQSPELAESAAVAAHVCARTAEHLHALMADADALEAKARSLAFGFAQSLALSLLCRHADWALRVDADASAVASANMFADLLRTARELGQH